MKYLALALLLPISVMAQPPVIVNNPSTTTPTTVVTPTGTYIIVPDYSTGSVRAVVKTSKGK